MAPVVVYAGALQPKKKYELQEIALALRISDSGTKDELQARIKKHLDSNQSILEDDPAFTGLFGRRKRSVQPLPQLMVEHKPRPSHTRRSNPLDAIHESTPAKDLRDVSTFLKNPLSPVETSPSQSPRHLDLGTPSSLPPLPPSPTKSLIEHLPKASDVSAMVEHIQQHDVLQNGGEMLLSLRGFLSNSRNIWSLTALFEILYVLSAIIPWKSVQLPLSPTGSGPAVSLNYPPLSIFQTSAFWLVILHWSIPTLLLPSFFGTLISFNPINAPSNRSSPPVAPFDPLTASIVRLAAQIAYPYASLDFGVGVQGLDVLGFRWRVLNASVNLAFAFAEAIAGAPEMFAQTFVKEQRRIRSESKDMNGRGALMVVEPSEAD